MIDKINLRHIEQWMHKMLFYSYITYVTIKLYTQLDYSFNMQKVSAQNVYEISKYITKIK